MKIKDGMAVIVVILTFCILSCAGGGGEQSSAGTSPVNERDDAPDMAALRVEAESVRGGSDTSSGTGDSRNAVLVREETIWRPPPFLGSGNHRVAVGLVRDASGNVVSGRVKIFQGSSLIGETWGEVFSLYDLPAGEYRLEFIPLNICTTLGRMNFTIGDALGRTEAAIVLNLDRTITMPEPPSVTPGGINLGATGRNLIFQGQTRDSRGRILDGVVKVFQGDTYLGYSTTSGGRFLIYDLRPGNYLLEFEPLPTIAATSGTVTVYAGGSTRSINITATYLE
jgi:hypothetical protein